MAFKPVFLLMAESRACCLHESLLRMILEEKVEEIQGVTMTPSLALKMAGMAHDKGCR